MNKILDGDTTIIEILIELIKVKGLKTSTQVEFWFHLFRKIKKAEDKTLKL
jgi:hypothetical protein